MLHDGANPLARILAVDDSDQNLTLIELYLRSPEFQVVSTRNGAEALDLAGEQDFDLILLDLAMPSAGGFEVCRRLKDNPRTALIPVIFLSARHRDEASKAQGNELTAIDCITKPFERDELLARIRAVLRMEAVRRQALDRARKLEDSLFAERIENQSLRGTVTTLQLLTQAQTRPVRDANLMLDSQGRTIARNEVFQALFGDVPLGLRIELSGLPGLLQLVASSAHGTGPFPYEEQGREPSIRWFEVRSETLAGRGFGNDVRLLAFREVTDLVLFRRELEGRRAFMPATPAGGPAASIAYSMTGVVGQSPSLQALVAQVDMLRRTRTTVLIHGESGTGKELVARALHYDGPFADRPFIPIHCGAISPELIESELFGHQKGSFTGAVVDKRGLFVAADGGTVFLDEIAETSHSLQVKLLRVLELGEVRPVGATSPLRVDVRILAATNQDLLRMVRDGHFREDLYYRLEVVTLRIPPLRERVEDIPPLVGHFLSTFNHSHGRLARPVKSVSRAALELLCAYPWPGNIRELENVVDRAFALGCGDVIQVEDLPERVIRGRPSLSDEEGPAPLTLVTTPQQPADSSGRLKAELEVQERAVILRALAAHGGDKRAAAKALGLPRSTFYRKLKELGIRDAE